MNARQRRRERRKGQYDHNVAAVYRSAWHESRRVTMADVIAAPTLPPLR